MSTAKPGELWEEPENGRRHSVIGSDPGSSSVLIDGRWRSDDLEIQGYTLVMRPASQADFDAALTRISELEARLLAANIP